ncbi:unnamed protein product, partial [Adineta steineri]
PGLNQARKNLTPTLPSSSSFDIPDGYENLPCVFALLPGRKKATYQLLFQELNVVAVPIGRTWKPQQIMTDFEISLIPAISD